MAQLMTPTVSLTGGDANLIKAPQQDVDVGSTLKATDNTPSIYQLGAKVAEGIYQYEAARESYVALDAQNKRDIEHSLILEEMQNDKGDWTPEKHNAYKTKIEEVADNYQAVIDGLSPLTQAASRQKSKQHSVEITDQFYKTSRKKQYDFELKTISASLTLEADKLYSLRNDPKKFAEQYQNVMDAYDNLSELSGISKGSAIYNEQKLKTSSSAIYQVVSSLIGTEELSRAQHYRKAYDKALTAEDRGRLDVQIFNLQDRLRREAEAQARMASAKKEGVDKVAQEKYHADLRWFRGMPTEAEKYARYEMQMLEDAMFLYNADPKKWDPEGKFSKPEDFLSILTNAQKLASIQTVNNEIKRNRARYDEQELTKNTLLDFVTQVQKSSQGQINQYTTFEDLLQALVANDAISAKDSNDLYAMYQSLTPSTRREFNSLMTDTPLESNGYALLEFNAMSDDVLVNEIESMESPMRVLTKEYGLNFLDAHKVMANYNAAKQYRQEKNVNARAYDFASSFFVTSGNKIETTYDMQFPALENETEEKLYKKVMIREIQRLFFREVDYQYQLAQKEGKNKTRDQIAAEIMIFPKDFAVKYQSEILSISEETAKNFKRKKSLFTFW